MCFWTLETYKWALKFEVFCVPVKKKIRKTKKSHEILDGAMSRWRHHVKCWQHCARLLRQNNIYFTSFQIWALGLRRDYNLCPWDCMVYPVLQYRRQSPSLLDLLSEFGLISDGWLTLYISIGRLSQYTWVLKVSVLETGHTRYWQYLWEVTHSDSHHLWYEHYRETPTINH